MTPAQYFFDHPELTTKEILNRFNITRHALNKAIAEHMQSDQLPTDQDEMTAEHDNSQRFETLYRYV